jgi:hypothetical protein
VNNLPQVTKSQAMLAVLLYQALDSVEWRQVNVRQLMAEEGVIRKDGLGGEQTLLKNIGAIHRSSNRGKKLRRGNCTKLFYSGSDDVEFVSGLKLTGKEEFDLAVVCGAPVPVAQDLLSDEMVVAANCYRLFSKAGSFTGEQADTLLSKETSMEPLRVKGTLGSLLKKNVLSGGNSSFCFGTKVLVTLNPRHKEVEVVPGKFVAQGQVVDLTSFRTTEAAEPEEKQRDGMLSLGVTGSIVAVALWEYFEEKKARLVYSPRLISEKLQLKEETINSKLNRLLDVGFLRKNGNGYVQGHGRFMPRFVGVSSIILDGGRTLTSGKCCDLREEGETTDAPKQAEPVKAESIVENVDTAAPAVELVEAEPEMGAAVPLVVERTVGNGGKNGDSNGNGKLVVVVGHNPEEIAAFVRNL